METTKANGPALAALLAAGIGCTVLGTLTTVAEANASFRSALALSSAVGPLSGKTIYAVVAWLLAWVIAAVVMRGKSYDLRPFFIATLVLIAIGLVGTFPLFFDLFA